MVSQRLSAYWARIREGLEAAFSEDHPPGDVATTFSVGVFVAALPNFGVALVLFAALARYVDRVSNLALVAAVLVMNPPVKWAVYVASFWIGSRILGPIPGVSATELSLSAGPAVFVRVFVGSVVVAAVAAVVGYVLALRFIRELRRRDLDVTETLPDAIVE